MVGTVVHECEKVTTCDDEVSLLGVMENKCRIGSVFDMFFQTNRQRLHPTSYFSVPESRCQAECCNNKFVSFFP